MTRAEVEEAISSEAIYRDRYKNRIAVTKSHKNYTDAELGDPTEAHGRIPSFANRDEEAAFWDTHDVTDFAGEELHQVEVEIGGDLAERLALRLDAADRKELARRARRLGVGPSTLA